MRTSYSLEDITRQYEAALATVGTDALLGAGLKDIGTLAIAEAAAIELRDTDSFQSAGAKYQPPPHDALIECVHHAERLFALLDLCVPTLDEFTAAGVNLRALAKEYDRLLARDASPTFIIAPMLALMNEHDANMTMNVHSWRKLYRLLTEHEHLVQNPLRARVDGSGLQLGQGIDDTETVRDLLAQEITAPDNAADRCVVDAAGTVWRLSIIPLAEAASPGNHPHTAFAGKHLRASEYLTLQALRVSTGKPLIDEFGWTWLDGTYQTASQQRSLAGVWVPGYGQVRIYSNPTGFAQERLRTRVAVRPL